jgi:hypothetical protein
MTGELYQVMIEESLSCAEPAEGTKEAVSGSGKRKVPNLSVSGL